jgi:DNA invertase Pin-like site-specific DNA recombinase
MSKRKPRTYAYLRVSTVDQDVGKFRLQILDYASRNGMGQVEFVEEKISGLTSWKKRRLGALVEEMQPGDKLLAPELSRLGRSLVQVLEVLNTLMAKGVSVFSIKEALVLNGEGLQAKIMSTMLALFADIERDLISSRTREALAARRKAGVRLGRPKGPGRSKLDAHRAEILRLLADGVPKTRVAKKFGTTVENLYQYLGKRGLLKKEGER